MSDETPAQPEGVDRTPTGEIKDQTPAPETPAEPAKATEGEKPSVLNEKATGVPEKYSDFKAPEGFDLNEDVIGKATPIFKDLGLNQDQAQRLVDFYADISKSAAQAPFKLWEDTQKAWVDEIKADPEIGGKLDQVRTTVARAIDGLGDAKLASEFRQAMDYTGAGNNPAFVKAFYRLAQMVTEGTNVTGGKPSPAGQREPNQARPSAAKALYPNLA